MENNKFILNVCLNPCWCEFCNRKIEKGEYLAEIYKSAWKGQTRTNICKECVGLMFIDTEIKYKDLIKLKKEKICENLENGK